MGASCHDHCHDHGFSGLSDSYTRVLKVVIALNAAMFAIEIAAGAQAQSMSLLADAMDFFADASTYGLTLFMIGRPLAWRARAALFKGLSLSVMGSFVLAATVYRVFATGMPEPFTMGVVGFLALAVNVGSALLLYRWRDGDSNVRSVWLCSRNDAIGNVAVMLAASGVFLSGTAWPDLIVAGIMAGLFLWSSLRITRQALGELHYVKTAAAPAAAA